MHNLAVELLTSETDMPAEYESEAAATDAVLGLPLPLLGWWIVALIVSVLAVGYMWAVLRSTVT